MFSSSSNRARVGAKTGPVQRLEREPRTKAATVNWDGLNQAKACTIRDINANGARISAASLHDIPPQFTLICKAEDLVAFAQVAWQRKDQAGVKFLRKGTLEQEAEFKRRQKIAYERFLEDSKQPAQDRSAFVERHEVQITVANYHVMGLDPTLAYSADQIKRQFRNMAHAAHPDRGGSVEQFQELHRAYNALISRLEPQ